MILRGRHEEGPTAARSEVGCVRRNRKAGGIFTPTDTPSIMKTHLTLGSLALLAGCVAGDDPRPTPAAARAALPVHPPPPPAAPRPAPPAHVAHSPAPAAPAPPLSAADSSTVARTDSVMLG